jgi:hypothetical protein
MKPLPLSPRRAPSALLSAALLALSAAARAQNVVHIEINAPSVVAGVQAVALPTMSLGAATPTLGQATLNAAPLPADVRVRGVAVAPHLDAALAAPAAAPVSPAAALPALEPAVPSAETPPGVLPAAPIPTPGAARPAEAISLAGGGAAVGSANQLAHGMTAAAQTPGGGAAKLRETIGAAFDGNGRLQHQQIDVIAGPVTAEELFGRGQAEELFGRSQTGLVPLKDAEADRLARLADQTARLRGIRATQGESALSAEDASVLRGIDDLARAVSIGNTTPAQLAAAARVVEGMDIGVLREFSAQAARFINTDVEGKSTPFARVGNVEHVNQQLIDPLADDGPALASVFKQNPQESDEHFVEALKALQYATDTGKQQNPDDMKAALARFNTQLDTGPNWYVNNFILPHEYASMQLVETLGRRAGMKPREILAFQRLIANHNFGPDLTDPKNAAMREHWWPKNFRQNMLPMLRAMGIDVREYFKADEHGVLQYNSTQGHPYALLLSAYDRAIAVGKTAHQTGNGNGLATWKKYGTQDFNGKKGQLKAVRARNGNRTLLLEPDPPGLKDEAGKAGPIFEFDGPSVIRAMEATADWAEQHVESLWASLYASLPEGGAARRKYPTWNSFRMYPPFYAQRKSIGSLNGLLRIVKDANPEGVTNYADVLPQSGVAYYRAESAGLAGTYRVVLERTGPGAFDPRSTDYDYAARLEVYRGGKWAAPEGPAFSGAGAVATRGPDPVALYVDFIRRDKGW